MIPLGKSLFIWQPLQIHNGDASLIVADLKAAGFQSAILHATNCGIWRSVERIELAYALKDAGIHTWGSAAVYGNSPDTEGCQGAAIAEQYGLAGFIFDAEQSFDDKPKSDTNAVKLLKAFRSEAPNRLAGWCWWARYKNPTTGSTWHPVKVLWAAMAPGYGDADFGMPMCYWEGQSGNNAVHLLVQSWNQWHEITDKPVIPIGRAYIGDNGTATPDAVFAFDRETRELGAPGISWWSMQHAHKLPDVWQALSETQPFAAANTPQPELTLAEKVDLLFAAHPELWQKVN